MAVAVEQIPYLESGAEGITRMPTPGTLAHLEYLSNLQTPANLDLDGLNQFMEETQAARSLSILIKQQRTYRPLRTPSIELDTRLMGLEGSWPSIFYGSLFRDPYRPDTCHLNIHSQPRPWEIGEADYMYDIFLPISYDFKHDPSRPVQAWYTYGGSDQELPGRKEVYNQMAFPEYKEDNPEILVRAIKESAADLLSLMNHIYMEDSDLAPRLTRAQRVSGNLIVGTMLAVPSGLLEVQAIRELIEKDYPANSRLTALGAFMGVAAYHFGKKFLDVLREAD